jgi:hypothetical protein
MQPTHRVAVRLLLSSGETRTIDGADSAALEDGFFIIRRRDPLGNRIDVVLTLRSQDVVEAEILANGVRTAYVSGKGVFR